VHSADDEGAKRLHLSGDTKQRSCGSLATLSNSALPRPARNIRRYVPEKPLRAGSLETRITDLLPRRYLVANARSVQPESSSAWSRMHESGLWDSSASVHVVTTVRLRPG
jgi:hypothetical protein